MPSMMMMMASGRRGAAAPTGFRYPHLYNAGEFEDRWQVGYVTPNSYVTKAAAHLAVVNSGGGDQEVAAVTDVPIDLTDVATIEIEWENDGSSSSSHHAYLIASTVQGGRLTTYNARLSRTARFARTVQTLDVSGLTGNYFVRVHAYGTGGWNAKVLVHRITLL